MPVLRKMSRNGDDPFIWSRKQPAKAQEAKRIFETAVQGECMGAFTSDGTRVTSLDGLGEHEEVVLIPRMQGG